MKHLIIDTEQEAILRQALVGVSAFLTARAMRRDPMGLISKAYRLQERKCSNLTFQLDQPAIAAWQEIDLDRQAEFERLIRAFLDQKSQASKAVIYTQLHAFITAQRVEPEKRKRLNSILKGEIAQ